MKVLLMKDVYKLGHAGDVRRVADGYGRNFLLTQGLAVLATPGALKQAENIRARANERRAELNHEMGGVAERLKDLVITFTSRAGETGKLYGSITPQMITDAIQKATDVQIDRRQIDVQPVRTLGEHKVRIRLTVDLIPEIKVLVQREGEVKAATPAAKPAPIEAAPQPAEVLAEAKEEATPQPTSEEPTEEQAG